MDSYKKVHTDCIKLKKLVATSMLEFTFLRGLHRAPEVESKSPYFDYSTCKKTHMCSREKTITDTARNVCQV